MVECKHKTYGDHTVGCDASKRLIWRCTNCEKTSAWSESWGYDGTVECLDCGIAVIEAVACSEGCRDALIAKGIITSKPTRQGTRAGHSRVPQAAPPRAERAQAMAAAMAAMKVLTVPERIEVLDALWKDEE